jgi:hypothetical protein
MADYKYMGDRLTDELLKGKTCSAVRRKNGKCIRGKNGNMLVSFDGFLCNVRANRLRKLDRK